MGSQICFAQQQLSQSEPVSGPTVFTDGSGKTGKAAIVQHDGQQWQQRIEQQESSPQVVELRAMVMVFQHFPDSVNVVTDSAYVAGLVQRLDKAVLGQVGNEKLFGVLKLLWMEIQQRRSPYYVMHIKSHTSLPGFIVEGNARADALVSGVAIGPVPNVRQQAIEAHSFFHQGHQALKRQFRLSNSEAHAIVTACPDCQGHHVPHYYGTNPRGLRALQIWQTDVTHIPEFVWLKYVHVSIDTFSPVVIATAHTGEAARDVIRHWQRVFSVARVPQQIKTDNDPAYLSTKVTTFLQIWGITHVTGIPHSPTGQGIVERTHGTLKHMLQQQKGGMMGEGPEARLNKVMYVLNFCRSLMMFNNHQCCVILGH